MPNLALQSPPQIALDVKLESSLNVVIEPPKRFNSVVNLPLSIAAIIKPCIINSVLQFAQGPAGPPGIPSGEDMPYAERTDIVTDNLIYKGEAAPGTIDASPLWRIRRLQIGTDGDVITQWANGNAQFDNVWSNRDSLGYL